MKKKTLLSLFCLTICSSFIFLKIKTLIAGKNLPSHHQASQDLIRWPTKFISRWNFQLVVYFLIVFMPQPLRIIFVLTLCCITFSMNMNMKWIYIMVLFTRVNIWFDGSPRYLYLPYLLTVVSFIVHHM